MDISHSQIPLDDERHKQRGLYDQLYCVIGCFLIYLCLGACLLASVCVCAKNNANAHWSGRRVLSKMYQWKALFVVGTYDSVCAYACMGVCVCACLEQTKTQISSCFLPEIGSPGHLTPLPVWTSGLWRHTQLGTGQSWLLILQHTHTEGQRERKRQRERVAPIRAHLWVLL